jgi:hypothetical protein
MQGTAELPAEDGRHGATVALELAERSNRFLSTVQVGIILLGSLPRPSGVRASLRCWKEC